MGGDGFTSIAKERIVFWAIEAASRPLRFCQPTDCRFPGTWTLPSPHCTRIARKRIP